MYLPHWLYDIKTNNRREDLYYTSRTLNTGEVNAPLGWMYLLWELYDRLYTLTNDSQWQTLANRTKTDTITATTFSNQSYVYRKNSGDVLEYPGTQITGSASRVTSGTLDEFVEVSGSDTLVVENISVETSITTDTTYTVEASADTDNRIIEFFISNITDDGSDASLYRQFWRLGDDSTLNSRTFASYELFNWESMSWYYGRGLISGTDNYEENSITYNDNTFDNVVLRLESDAQLDITNASTNPPSLFCKVTTNPATLRIKDGGGFYWDYSLDVGDWTTVTPTWAEFTWSSINTVVQSGRTPSQTTSIQELYILTTGNVYVWWIGVNPPQALTLPSVAFRAGVRDTTGGTRNLYVGDVYPSDTPSDRLSYTPGVVPFARNITSGVAGNLTGLPYAAYQNPLSWIKWEEPEFLANVIQFLQASQAHYSSQIGDTGPFSPVYTWQDINNVSLGGTVNQFGFNGPDNYETSGLYQAQIGVWLGRAWYENRESTDLRNLALSWINWLDQVYATRNSVFPPDSFPSNAVATGGFNPGVQALIGEAALWCNLAGGSPAATFRWINRSLTFLNSQLVEPGNPMSGSWSYGQAPFNILLKEYYSAWHGQCINFLSLLSIYKEQITYPPCSEPLTISPSEPFPEICCGAEIISNIVSDCGIGVTTGSQLFPSSGIISECRLDVHLGQSSSGVVLWFAVSSTDYLGFFSSETLELE